MYSCTPVKPIMMLPCLWILALGGLTTACLSLPMGVQNSQVKNMLPWKQDAQFLRRQGDRHARSADIELTGCPKGFFVDGYNEDNQLTPEAKCEPCPFGTYNEVEGNLAYKCSLCREACDRKKEVELVRCTPMANRICACAQGYQEERPEPDLICILDPRYMPCKAGERIKFNGMEIWCEDCPEDTTSFGNSTTCVPMYTAPSFLTVAPHAAGSEQGIIRQWKALAIIIVVAFLLVITIISVVIYCCVQRKRKPHEQKNHKRDNMSPSFCNGENLKGFADTGSKKPSAPPQTGDKANGSVASHEIKDGRNGYSHIRATEICQPTDDIPPELTGEGETAAGKNYTNFNKQAGKHFGVQLWEQEPFLSQNRHAEPGK